MISCPCSYSVAANHQPAWQDLLAEGLHLQEIGLFLKLGAEQPPSTLDPREGAQLLGRRNELKQQKPQPKALISCKA